MPIRGPDGRFLKAAGTMDADTMDAGSPGGAQTRDGEFAGMSSAEIQLLTSFGGAGSVSNQPNYLTRNPLLISRLLRKNWLIRNGVEIPADDMTREGVKITDADLDGQEIDALQKSLSTKGVWRDFTNGVKKGRAYGGAIGVIVIKGQDFSTPLRLDAIGKGSYARMIVMERRMISGSNINDLVTDPESPWFGTPKFYSVQYGYAGLPEGNIHHTRVIRFIGQEMLSVIDAMTENGWGLSVIEPAYESFLDYTTVNRSIAGLTRRASLRILSTDNYDQAVSMGGSALRGLQKRVASMEMFQHNNSITMFDKATTAFSQETVSFGSLPEVMQQFVVQQAAAWNIPVTLLFRDSPSGMNATGDSDFKGYHYYIGQLQESFRFYLDYLLNIMHRSVLGKEPSQAFDWNWNPLDKPSDTEMASMAQTVAGVAKGVLDVGAKPSVALKIVSDSSDRTGGILPKISQEDMDEADAEPPPPGEDDGSGEEGVPQRLQADPPLLGLPGPQDPDDPDAPGMAEANVENGYEPDDGTPDTEAANADPANPRGPANAGMPPRAAMQPTGRPAATRDDLEALARAEASPMTGVYLNRRVDDDDAEAIRAWALANDIPEVLPAKDMHVTIIHSSRAMPGDIELDDEGLALPEDADRRLAVFNDSLVLLLDAPDLQDRFEALRLKGASSDFPKYRPHVTIAKCGPWGVPDKLESVRPYAEAITLCPEEIDDIDAADHPIENLRHPGPMGAAIASMDDGGGGGGGGGGGSGGAGGGAGGGSGAGGGAGAGPGAGPGASAPAGGPAPTGSVYAVTTHDPDTHEVGIGSVHASEAGARTAAAGMHGTTHIDRIDCGTAYPSHVSLVYAPTYGLVYGHRHHKRAMSKARELGRGGTKFEVTRKPVSA